MTDLHSPDAGAGASAPAPPSPRVEAARLLRRYAEHERAKARVEADAVAQIAEITEWRDAEVRRHESEMAGLLARMEWCIAAELQQNPLRRRSVPLPGGVAGYRTPAPTLVVEDAEAFAAWVREHRPDWLCKPKPPAPDLSLVKSGVQEAEDGSLRVSGPEEGETLIVPGCRMEHPGAKFYVRVNGVGDA
jgi:phage host-nuclease inhibitor protein Gam